MQAFRLHHLAIFIGVFPVLAININYLIAATEGFVPWCVPYWDSCTSISATGRQGTAYYFFKLTMLPAALFYLWYWAEVKRLLHTQGYQGRAVPLSGQLGAVAMMLYTVALGAVGDQFQLIRRIGIILFFTLTYLSQLLVIYRLGKLQIDHPSRDWQLWLCSLILLIGLATLLLDVNMENYDDIEDAFEWNIALLLHINFLLAAIGWKHIDPVCRI